MILMNFAQTIAYSNQEKSRFYTLTCMLLLLGDLYFIQLQTSFVTGRIIDKLCAGNNCSMYHIIFLYFSSQQGQEVLMFYYTERTCSVPKARLGGIVFQFTVIAMTKRKKITSFCFCQRGTKQDIEQKNPFTQFSYFLNVSDPTMEFQVVQNGLQSF